MASVTEALLTAEEFGRMPDDGRRTELVRGRIIELPPPRFGHGKVCFRVAMTIGQFVDAGDLGHVLSNDSGIVTERDPDTVRGADIAFFSYARQPKGPLPATYADVAPELIFEVRSPSDRRGEIQEKVDEYLAAGVLVVCVLDPEPRNATLHRPGAVPVTLGPDEELTFPECLPGFAVVVGLLFE